MVTSRHVIAIAGALLLGRAPALGQAHFHMLDLVPGDEGSDADGVSIDGRTVSLTGQMPLERRAERWTRTGGVMVLPGLPPAGGGRSLDAAGMSADGTVHVVNVSGGGIGIGAYLWSESLPPVFIGTQQRFQARGVSGDGLVVVGRGPFNTPQAMLWTAQGGFSTLTNTIGGSAFANAASHDGSVIVGGAGYPGPFRAWRWTAQGGMENLGTLNSGDTVAQDVSADGSVVVGDSGNAIFRWTSQSGMVQIADTGGTDVVQVSDDGSLVLVNTFPPAATQINGYLWDAAHGRRELQDLVGSLPGFVSAEWATLSPQAISGDGTTIVGVGYTPGFTALRAWRAVLVPGICSANCDGSTTPPVLNVNDFICFQTKYAAGDPGANCDQSTTPPVLNVNDFLCFQIQYAAGCP